jgi:hypothetical protein
MRDRRQYERHAGRRGNAPPEASPLGSAALRGMVTMGLIALASVAPRSAEATTWRVGDAGQPWELYPVSFLLNAGEAFKPDYIWGGAHATEIVVDDDGDGLIDEDPVDVVDNDLDGLFNEDPLDGIDNDRDGVIDEDDADPQYDNDGDGLLNEDGLRTGGIIYDPSLRTALTDAPYFRHATPADAAADPEGPGYGWGDDDHDVSFNEDPIDGVDNDNDGLVDEDPEGAPRPLPNSWLIRTFSYDVGDLTQTQLSSIPFIWDAETSSFIGEGPGGALMTATSANRRFTPSDWLRPIRLTPDRNISLLTVDRFMSGEFSNVDPTDSQAWGATLTGTSHEGTSGHGQVADGNIFTARAVSQRSSSAYFRIHFLAMYWLDLIRMRPRPDFPDRTPTSFDIWYAGDRDIHFRTSFVLDELRTRMVTRDPIIPRQIDQTRPPIKEYRFGDDEEYSPKKARILNFSSQMPEGQTWELSEFEAYGHGYALDAAYVSEIIDVGTPQPRFRRYFDLADANRPIALETIQTIDSNDDGTISDSELASSRVASQFDAEAAGSPVTWGRVRWSGRVEGDDADLQIRVRSGTSLDTKIYQRKVGRGVVSLFTGPSIVADWPAPGSRLELFSYTQLSGLTRSPVKDLPENLVTDKDGIQGGWTPWSAPFDFVDGQVTDGATTGGILLPLPPLHRYIQFQLDFISGEDSGISLDYLEFDFSSPVVSRGILAEIFPDTAAVLGLANGFSYVLKPDVSSSDVGFNRIDIAVPSPQATLDSMFVDDLRWERILPAPPSNLDGAEATAWVASRLSSKVWLDTMSIGSGSRFAAATYFDSSVSLHKLGIKTRTLTSSDFPRGQDREIEIGLTTPVYRLLTGFDSWIWNESTTEDLQQPTQPGNASDRLPSDAVSVTVLGSNRSVSVREVSPNPFTPNGDGINDVAAWVFDVFLLTASTDISITVYNLSGREIRKIVTPSTAGELAIEWDGRDEAGNLVPPGIYLYRLFVDSDTDGSKQQSGTVAVAY